jgi:hypothetical protein
LPQKICSPNLLLSRSKERSPTEAALNKEAAALFQFKTAVWCKKPPASKKRKVDEAASGEEGEVEAAPEKAEDILAQVPLPLPEPEEVPVIRLTRARRVDTA